VDLLHSSVLAGEHYYGYTGSVSRAVAFGFSYQVNSLHGVRQAMETYDGWDYAADAPLTGVNRLSRAFEALSAASGSAAGGMSMVGVDVPLWGGAAKGVSAPRNALGRGSTADFAKGTWLPSSLREQLAVEQAAANPAAGTRLPFQMTDPRWPASQGWVKMDQKIMPVGAQRAPSFPNQPVVQDIVSERITVHYVYNTITGQVDDFKIVTQGAR
jgi:hypothetical protein